MRSNRGTWQTRIGFYLVAIGSALGLGNLWRFPYVVGENGGGAFVLLYMLLILLIGAPLLILELMMGKMTGQSVLMATKTMEQKQAQSLNQAQSLSTPLGASSLKTQGSKNDNAKLGLLPLRWFGRFSLVLSLVVLSYYSVISGWVLHFLTQFIMKVFSTSSIAYVPPSMEFLQNNGALQLALASVHILFALVLVLKGFQEGVEKFVSLVMPVFAVLVGVLLWKSISLPTFPQSLRFLFYPDFSKLSLSSLNHAIGHVFFTLSVGFGTMVTFGSYMREEEHIPTTGFRVALFDTLVSLLGVMMVFPVAFQASNVPMTDPTLLFDVIPRFILDLPGGAWFGMLFFLCLYMAALNASLGLLETIVSNLDDRSRKWDRSKSAWAAAGAAMALASLPSLSSTILSQVRVGGKGFIEIMDSFLINWLLPLIALGIAFSFAKGISEKERKTEFVGEHHIVSHVMYTHWDFAIRFLAPGIILIGIILQIIGWLF